MILRHQHVSLILLPLLLLTLLQKGTHSLTSITWIYPRNSPLLERHFERIGCPSRKRQQQSCAITTSMRGGSDDDKKRHENIPKMQGEKPLVSRLLNAFFNGVTMPFPTLRKLSEHLNTDNQEPKKIQVGFSVRESILAIVFYLTLGMISYSSTILQKDHAWSWVDALYFGGKHCRLLEEQQLAPCPIPFLIPDACFII